MRVSRRQAVSLTSHVQHKKNSDRPAPVGLAPEWECLERLRLSTTMICTIQGARAASTRACYTAKRTVFQCWTRAWTPLRVPCHMCFLSSNYLDKNLTFGTICFMLLLFLVTKASVTGRCSITFDEAFSSGKFGGTGQRCVL